MLRSTSSIGQISKFLKCRNFISFQFCAYSSASTAISPMITEEITYNSPKRNTFKAMPSFKKTDVSEMSLEDIANISLKGSSLPRSVYEVIIEKLSIDPISSLTDQLLAKLFSLFSPHKSFYFDRENKYVKLFLETLKKRDIPIDFRLLHQIYWLKCSLGMKADSSALLNYLQKIGKTPTQLTYRLLETIFSSAGDSKALLTLINFLSEKQQLNFNIFYSLVYCEALNGDWDKVQAIFNTFAQKNEAKLDMNVLYFRAALGFAKFGDFELLKKTFELFPNGDEIQQKYLFLFLDIFLYLSSRNFNAVDLMSPYFNFKEHSLPRIYLLRKLKVSLKKQDPGTILNITRIAKDFPIFYISEKMSYEFFLLALQLLEEKRMEEFKFLLELIRTKSKVPDIFYYHLFSNFFECLPSKNKNSKSVWRLFNNYMQMIVPNNQERPINVNTNPITSAFFLMNGGYKNKAISNMISDYESKLFSQSNTVEPRN